MSATLEAARMELATLLVEASAIPGIDSAGLAALHAKFAEHAFHLVVAGEFKRGKSTLINALLSAEVLPMGVVPLTSVITSLRHGATADVTVMFKSGESDTVPLETLADYVTERGNPDNCKGVREVRVTWPAAWLEGGIRLVDTPGVGSVHRHNTEITARYLPEADAVIFVVSADQPLGRNELDFLAEIRCHAGKVLCLLNKVDYLSAAEQEESLAFTRDVLRETMDADIPVFAVSARQALQARIDNDAQGWHDSGLATFDQALRRFLREEGGDLWIGSMRRQARRLLAESRLALALERQALTLPLATLEANLAAFAQKKQVTLQARFDLDPLLQAEGRKLLRQRIEPDLAAFTHELRPRLQASLTQWYDDLRHGGAAVLQTGLEAGSIGAVRTAFDAWRTEENVVANQAFERVCQRFWQGVRDTVDELLRYSAELFAVPFDAVAADSLWRLSSNFYYKFWDEPSTMGLLSRGLIRLMPGAIGHPLILRRARRRVDELIDMQSGRVRHDFEERLGRSAENFRREMHARIDKTIAGVEAAIEAGRANRQASERDDAPRVEALTRQLVAIQTLESQMAPSTISKTSNNVIPWNDEQ